MDMIIKMTDARRDQDHLNMLVSNHSTIPDRTEYILGRSGVSPLPAMIHDAKMLESAGCDLIVIPCNTAHYFYDAISEAVNIPIINIIEETVRYAVEKNHVKHNLGILATSGTIHSLTYHRVCESYGLNCITPDDTVQNAVMDIIYNQVKAGIAVNRDEMNAVINYMRARGCEAIVMGCTELSVVYRDLQMYLGNDDILDSLTVLAEKTILAGGKKIRTDITKK